MRRSRIRTSEGWLRALDVSLNRAYKIKERVELQPGVNFSTPLCQFCRSEEHSERRAQHRRSVAGGGRDQRRPRATARQPSRRIGFWSNWPGVATSEFSLKLGF
jgi:hypothetical protein